MDPLTLLREFVVSGHADQVVLNGDRVDFGGRYSFARSIPTSYKSQQGKEDFYKLESLLYFVKNFLTTAAAPKYTDYFKSAKQLNLEPVSFLDRKVQGPGKMLAASRPASGSYSRPVPTGAGRAAGGAG